MPYLKEKFSNSTYGVHFDFSYRNEMFYSISSSWRPGSRCILKIRIAKWKPKQDRSNNAIMYHEVTTKEEALVILNTYKDFDFLSIEDEFEAMWKKDNFDDKGYFNTGETDNWWNNKFFPYMRNYINNKINNQTK